MMSFFAPFKSFKRQIVITAVIYLAFALFAIRIILLGASLLDLEIRIQETFSLTSKLVTVHSIGYLIGAIIGGFLERFFNLYLVLAFSSILSAVCMLITPWLYSFVQMAVLIFCAGIGHSTFDLTCHAALINLWNDNVGNFIQILHMCFSVGGLLGPIIVRPFLLPLPDKFLGDGEQYRALYNPNQVVIMWPWTITCIVSFVVSIALLVFYFNSNKSEAEKSEVATKDSAENGTCQSVRKTYVAAFYVALIASHGFAIQDCICCFVQAFGVKSALQMDKQTAALVNSAFWLAFMVAKIAFVGFSSLIKEQLMVNFCLFLMLIALALTYLFATVSTIALWCSTIIMGLGYSPLFAVAYSSLGKYFEIKGTHTSTVFIVGIIGDSIHTPIVGTLLDNNPNIYAYYLTSLGAAFMVQVWLLPYFFQWLFGRPQNLDCEVAKRPRSNSFMLPESPRRLSIASRKSQKIKSPNQ